MVGVIRHLPRHPRRLLPRPPQAARRGSARHDDRVRPQLDGVVRASSTIDPRRPRASSTTPLALSPTRRLLAAGRLLPAGIAWPGLRLPRIDVPGRHVRRHLRRRWRRPVARVPHRVPDVRRAAGHRRHHRPVRLREPVRGYMERALDGRPTRTTPSSRTSRCRSARRWRTTWAIRTLRRLTIADAIASCGFVGVSLFSSLLPRRGVRPQRLPALASPALPPLIAAHHRRCPSAAASSTGSPAVDPAAC